MALKSNVSDVTRMFEEMSVLLDSKASFNDLNTVLKDYAQKRDLHEVMLRGSE